MKHNKIFKLINADMKLLKFSKKIFTLIHTQAEMAVGTATFKAIPQTPLVLVDDDLAI
jgi:hypothetical protein